MSSAAKPPPPLPRGPHGLPRQLVAQNQRERMLIAMVAAVGEKGYTATTVDDVVGRSAVSKTAFYEQFRNKEDCFFAAYAEVIGRLGVAVDEAYRTQRSWQARVVAGVGALLEFFASAPEAARLAFIEIMAAGPAALERYRLTQRAFAAYLEDVARESGYRGEVSDRAALAAISGMVANIAELVREGRTSELPAIRDELTQFGIAIFAGAAAAERAVREAAAEMDGTPPDERPVTRPPSG
jgi:AcrR family transcriptional regulator